MDNVDIIEELTVGAFGEFIEDVSNADLVSASKYGIHERLNSTFVTKEITEEEIPNYVILTNVDFASGEVATLNSEFKKYPFVKLK